MKNEYVKDTFFLKLKAIQNPQPEKMAKVHICQRYFFSKIESNSKPNIDSYLSKPICQRYFFSKIESNSKQFET